MGVAANDAMVMPRRYLRAGQGQTALGRKIRRPTKRQREEKAVSQRVMTRTVVRLEKIFARGTRGRQRVPQGHGEAIGLRRPRGS
jgi:hypothetical protein